MAIFQRIIVFDFDGTLVDSNVIKRDAYFEIFPHQYPFPEIITRTLQRDFEQPRQIIIAEILRQVAGSFTPEEVQHYAAAYGTIVFDGVANCPALPGADQALEAFSSHHALYLSSNTPEDSLHDLVGRRGWLGYFQGIFGQPHRKPETLHAILVRERAEPSELLVVGDGASDRLSAQAVGCVFFPITQPTSLLKLVEIYGRHA